jgi:DNA ligase-associated metallophosphoesterase
MLQISLQGEEMALLPQRALYWPAQKTLIVADLHWGKSGHFRKHGIAIPGSTQTQDEIRLATLVREYAIERLIIAGDLFHSRHNKEVDLFTHWRNAHSSLHIDFVTGNHDILAPELYDNWNLSIHHEGLQAVPFYIAHDEAADCGSFCIHGHIHPAVRITGKGRASIKLSCFAQDANRLILPAFGEFTGNYLLEPSHHRHIYVIAGSEVVKWS